MRLLEAQTQLLAVDRVAWTTGDAAVCLGLSLVHASKVLARLAEAGALVSLARGRWVFRDRLKSLALPGILTAPFPAYVSLQSALYYHGIISQIPSVLYAVSLARSRSYETPLGAVSIHHVDPSFFFGFEPVGEQGAQLAIPEKAVLDVLYLGCIGSGGYTALPELELPKKFSAPLARRMMAKIKSARMRTLVQRRFDKLVLNLP